MRGNDGGGSGFGSDWSANRFLGVAMKWTLEFTEIDGLPPFTSGEIKPSDFLNSPKSTYLSVVRRPGDFLIPFEIRLYAFLCCFREGVSRENCFTVLLGGLTMRFSIIRGFFVLFSVLVSTTASGGLVDTAPQVVDLEFDGSDFAYDAARSLVYVSIPTRNELAVVSLSLIHI